MSLINELENKLKTIKEVTPFDFSINTKISHDKITRSFLTFFKNEIENDYKWSIELSFSLIDNAWANGELNVSSFLKNCTYALLKKFHIYNLSGNGCEMRTVNYNNELSIPPEIEPVFKSFSEVFDNGFRDANTIVFNDEPKSGKSTFIKYYCNELLRKQANNPPKIWWLNFNNGHDAVIIDFMMELYSQKLQDKTSYLIIDNLECCGYTKGANIADFFIDLVNVVKRKGLSIKLIIVQDNNKMCYDKPTDKNRKIYFSEKVSEEIKNRHLDGQLTDIHYGQIADDINALLKNEEIDFAIKRFFVKIIFFSRYGVNLRINENNFSDKEDIYEIEKIVRGIKLMRSGEVISFSKSFCEKILNQFESEFKEILKKSDSTFISQNGNFNSNILECYYTYISENGLTVSTTDFYKILMSVNKRSPNIENYLTVLQKAEDANARITSTILDTSKSKIDRFFGYHLGAILFASEALATYASQDWNTLKAWIKLHAHIKKTFNIDGQQIYICNGMEQNECTIKDFKSEESKPPINCISNQIKLHDEVSGQCLDLPYTELTQSDVEKIWLCENKEGLFRFYLSPIQNEKKNKNDSGKIDIDKFYRTYMLALLFEFEVMAPEDQRDTARIEKLWSIIKSNCIKSDKFHCKYFYPARVPWVTARMALAMSACFKNYGNQNICDEIASFTQDVGEYLVKSSIKFVKDGKTYRFWSSGTGLWNSTLETTIICAFALKEFAYSKFRNIVEEGINFINLFKENWFSNNMIADGIWAYQATEYFQKNNVYSNLKSFVSMTENIDFNYNANNRNDKSLGNSHIAKTYIDLVKDFIAVKPDLLNDPEIICEDEACGNSADNGLVSENIGSAVPDNANEALTIAEAINFKQALEAQQKLLKKYKNDPKHISDPNVYGPSISKCEKLLEEVEDMLNGLSDTNYIERKKKYDDDSDENNLYNRIKQIIG